MHGDEIDRRAAPCVLVSILDISTDVLLRVVVEKLHVRLAQEDIRDDNLITDIFVAPITDRAPTTFWLSSTTDRGPCTWNPGWRAWITLLGSYTAAPAAPEFMMMR